MLINRIYVKYDPHIVTFISISYKMHKKIRQMHKDIKKVINPMNCPTNRILVNIKNKSATTYKIINDLLKN